MPIIQSNSVSASAIYLPPIPTVSLKKVGVVNEAQALVPDGINAYLDKYAAPAPKPKLIKPVTPMDGFLFGADPEMFVVDEKGELVCAEGLIPGTKAQPYKVEGGAVQVDGMAAEFNIDPADNFFDFSNRIDMVIGQLKAMLPKGYDLVARPAVTFPEEVFDNAPDCAKELGCTPDYDAWTGAANPPPDASKFPRLRTASGHIHIGWTDGASLSDPDHVRNCFDLVKQLDYFVGAWSVLEDTDNTRRSLYGKAGACRIKPYGVEYRVLSNFWLTTPERRVLVWNRVQDAIKSMSKVFFPEKASNFNDALIQAINTSDLPIEFQTKFAFPIALSDSKYASDYANYSFN